MPARATSSGTISFGLVSIPVKLYTATSSQAVRFSMLGEQDKARLKQQYISSKSGEVVDRKDTVRGYEYQRGQYVVVSDDELKAIERKTDRSIEIEAFLPMEKVDPIYFDRSNLLGPDKGGAKAYQLLCAAMRDTGMVAVGRFSTRGREQLVLLRPARGGLMMHSLYYADEVRSFDDVELGDDVELKDAELDLAKQLIGQLSVKTFDPGQYEDEYRKAVLEMIDRKVAGEEIVAVPQEEPREQIIDLVAALKQSLGDGGGDDPTPKKRARKAAKPAARKKAARRKTGTG